MRVIVDRDRCEGTAICVGIDLNCSNSMTRDYVVVTADIPAEAVERAEQAIAECPCAALHRIRCACRGVDRPVRTGCCGDRAAAGLGRAEAIGLARSGATVVVNDMAQAIDASDVLDEIAAAGTNAVAVTGDVSQRATADEIISAAEDLGGLDIVVNNAGIYPRPDVVQHDRRGLGCRHRRSSARVSCRRAMPPLAEQGQGTRGVGLRAHHQHLIGGGLSGPAGQANHGAAKAGYHGADAIGESAGRYEFGRIPIVRVPVPR